LETVKGVTLGPDLDKRTSNGQQPEGQLLQGYRPKLPGEALGVARPLKRPTPS
jgi:hypothetical protein